MSTTRISQRELESYLWGAAIVLRGLIDAGDYKQYIFPLVFLKRISDVYDEEHAAAMEIYGDEDLADLPENHRFAIPDGCHWDDIRSVTQNIGATVLKAMRAIESANPDTLPGVFGDGDWGNKNLLPDSTLADLIEHFSSQDTVDREPARGRARQRLRVPHQEVRRRLRPHRPGVLHQPHPRTPDDTDAGTPAGRVRLRPHLRHRRHAHLGRRRGEAAGQGVAQPAPLRPGAQLRNLRDRAHEPLPARHHRRAHRARRHPRPAGVPRRQGTVCRPSTSSSPIRRTRSRRGTVQPSRRTPTAATCGASRRRAAPTTPSSSTSPRASTPRPDAPRSSSRTASSSAAKRLSCAKRS